MDYMFDLDNVELPNLDGMSSPMQSAGLSFPARGASLVLEPRMVDALDSALLDLGAEVDLMEVGMMDIGDLWDIDTESQQGLER
eukprot:2952228-Prymnesium_polylepis.1